MVAQFEMPVLKGSVSEGAGPKRVSLLCCCSANTICADQAQLISLYGSESVCSGTAVLAGGQSHPAAA